MADLTIDQFNDLNVSALNAPGDVPEPVVEEAPSPEVTPEPETEVPSATPEAVIEDFVGGMERQHKAQTFAEKRRQAEAELQAKEARIAELAARYDGLAEFAEELERNPALQARIAQAYQETVAPQPSAPRYQPPASAASTQAADPRIAALEARLTEAERRQMNANLHAARQVVQGRHHLSQNDMATVLSTAVARGWFQPGMLMSDVERVLEDARIIAFAHRTKTEGQKELLDKVDKAQKAVLTGGGSQPAQRAAYNASGKSIAQVRADALRAGARGL